MSSAPPRPQVRMRREPAIAPSSERRRQQDHHQPVGLELDGARRRQRVDADRDEPHDRHERDQRGARARRLDDVHGAVDDPLDGHVTAAVAAAIRAGRGASSSPATQAPAKTALPTAIAAPPMGSVAISASMPSDGQRERERSPARLARGRGSQVAGGGAHGRGLAGVVGVRCDARGGGGRPPATRVPSRCWCRCWRGLLARARRALRRLARDHVLDLGAERHRRHLERGQPELRAARERALGSGCAPAWPARRRARRRCACGAGSGGRARARARRAEQHEQRRGDAQERLRAAVRAARARRC